MHAKRHKVKRSCEGLTPRDAAASCSTAKAGSVICVSGQIVGARPDVALACTVLVVTVNVTHVKSACGMAA